MKFRRALPKWTEWSLPILPDKEREHMTKQTHTLAAEAVYIRGIRANLHQFIQQAIQVFFIGLVIGMERNVLPVLSQDFGVPKGSFLFLMSFVVSFGFVKGILNFIAGRLSERIGRKKVLLLGWVAAIPIPFMILYAPSWGWIVAANIFLGINQGFAWSMTVTSKVDITRADQRGFATGVNEFAGYAAVGIGGLVTGYLAVIYGPREALFGFGLSVIVTGMLTAFFFIKETLPWAKVESKEHSSGSYVVTVNWLALYRYGMDFGNMGFLPLSGVYHSTVAICVTGRQWTRRVERFKREDT